MWIYILMHNIYTASTASLFSLFYLASKCIYNALSTFLQMETFVVVKLSKYLRREDWKKMEKCVQGNYEMI